MKFWPAMMILTVALMLLKATGLFGPGWGWTMAPLWLPMLLALMTGAFAALVALVGVAFISIVTWVLKMVDKVLMRFDER